ncbi:hypothetical protein ACTMTI_05980 [Nonomuraea sp. H19]|uniref:hypothetical protein n=1 Tax=Nonomuraea sp. H19 TaxID=3452206 RepID=UPI003F8B6BE0
MNDHLLKQAWPGLLTGKLSDVAGLVVAPALLALLFWRRADLAATVLTGVAFALVKTTEAGAELASHAWTLVAGPSRVLADPTDLLALPALALAWWVRRRSLTAPSSARWRIIVTMPMAVLAVTATSSSAGPPAADSVHVKDGRITVSTDYGTAWSSEDGGLTWSDSGDQQDELRPPAGCVPYQATRCYRLVPGRMAVEQSDDAGTTWRPSWSPSGDDLKRLTRRYDDASRLRSMALGVQARPDGHVVVVANGLDGILVRDVAGTWRRVGWPDGTENNPVDLSPEIFVAIFLAGCTLFGAAGAGLRRHHGVYLGFAAAACLSFFALSNSDQLRLPGDLEAWVRLVGVCTILTGIVVCFALLIAGRARPAPVAVGVLAAPLVYMSVSTPFHGWAAGTPGPYWVAVVLAVLLTALVLLGSVALVRSDARRASSRTPPTWPE